MDYSAEDFEKYLNKKSSRHHYIPQFLINGFTDSNGLLFIYDKQRDVILPKQRPSKSVFFETDRNTIELNGGQNSSILEDLFYADIDNKTSKVIKYLQTEKLTEINLTLEITSKLLFFLIDLFWRLPKTDGASEDLFRRTKILTDESEAKRIKEDPAFKKLQRAGLFEHHINEMVNYGDKGNKWFNIHQNQFPIYVIGDYPFLFRRKISEFREFNDIDMLFAVSSTRIYSSTNQRLENFKNFNSCFYNAAIINQSVKYVACGDLDILKKSILFYKELSRLGLLYSTESAFKTK